MKIKIIEVNIFEHLSEVKTNKQIIIDKLIELKQELIQDHNCYLTNPIYNDYTRCTNDSVKYISECSCSGMRYHRFKVADLNEFGSEAFNEEHAQLIRENFVQRLANLAAVDFERMGLMSSCRISSYKGSDGKMKKAIICEVF